MAKTGYAIEGTLRQFEQGFGGMTITDREACFDIDTLEPKSLHGSSKKDIKWCEPVVFMSEEEYSQLTAARERIKELEEERKQCSELNNCDLPSLYEQAEQEAARLREALRTMVNCRLCNPQPNFRSCGCEMIARKELGETE